MFDRYFYLSFLRHPTSAHKRRVYRKKKRGTDISKPTTFSIERVDPAGVSVSANARVGGANNGTIVHSDHLSFLECDHLIAQKLHISLTVTPPRAITEEFFDVLECLLRQSPQAKNIFLALPTTYRRNFEIDWNEARPIVLRKIQERFGDRITVISCEDQGPATKLLGVIEYAESHDLFDEQDRILVVDDDMLYSPQLTQLHELCHKVYQCDVAAINQDLVIKDWTPLKFHHSNAVFADFDEYKVFGWLSFSIRVGATRNLAKFFNQIVALVPTARFHDDAIFSAYLRHEALYTTQILTNPLGSALQTNISDDESHALRLNNLSNSKIRKQSEKRIAEVLLNGQINHEMQQPLFEKISNHFDTVLMHSENPHISVDAHRLSSKKILLTLTLLKNDLVGTQTQLCLNTVSSRMVLPLNLIQKKFTVMLLVDDDMF